ncbi:C4-dicarboxylate transporter DcuC [Tundrisphaera sp. TA3]|uniref:C4-dicarboxylate transporter DcuC n=1 Tax=Tundrisphaera sp. TA3 TaxID=3435775 RepID=UPI003EB7BD1E
MGLLVLNGLILAIALGLMIRRVDVRVVLIGAGLALATLAGRPLAVADTFARSMVAPMVAPICASMGFAAALGVTGCDRQLVRLLTSPLRRARWAVLPGGIVASYLVNLAVPSQSSTAAMLGPILLPLIVASGCRRDVAAAALVLGSSFGGDLLNPGAQDLLSIAGTTGMEARALYSLAAPANLAGLLVAAIAFPLLNRRGPAGDPMPLPFPADGDESAPSIFKAAVPLVPVTLLLVAHAGWAPMGWLIRVPDGEGWRPLAGALPVVRAMLIGVLVAGLLAARDIPRLARGFSEGMGSAYGNVIALTVAAQCFGAGIAASGLGDAMLRHAGHSPGALAASAMALPWGLAAVSGSGSGPVLAFAQIGLAPLGDRPGAVALGALTCLAAGFGRTMSPVSAVVVCGAGLAGVAPLDLIRRLLPALLLGAVASLAMVARAG